MKKFIGTSVLFAMTMTLGDYNSKRGWVISEGEDPNKEGYITEKESGHISWQPKEVFEKVYKEEQETNSPGHYGLLHLGRGDFGLAVRALKDGKKVCRSGWNGKGMFVFMQVPSIIGKEIVPKMQFLPQSVKDEFEKRFNDENHQIDAIYYENQLALVNTSNLITGWSPSTSDVLSEDWLILE